MGDSAGSTPSAEPRRHCPSGCVDEALASRLIAAASDLALTVDRAGVIEEVCIGEAVAAHAPWKKLVGRRWSETASRDSQSKVEQLLREARAGNTSRPREINQKAEGASDVPFRFSAVLLDKERVVALGRDLRAISVLQQEMLAAQQAMDRQYERQRQTETRYRLLFHVCSESVVVADGTSLKVLETNPAAATLFDQPQQALAGLTLDQLFEARSFTQVQALAAAVEAGGRPGDAQVQLRGGRGEATLSVSLFRQSGATMLLLRLRPAGVPQAASGPRGSRLLAVLDALPDGFVVIGEDRRVLSANAAFCELVQQASESQVIGEPLDRWLGRPGVDLNILLANLREHGSVRNFSTIVRGDYGGNQEAVVSAVSALDGKVPCLGFVIRTAAARLAVVPNPGSPMARSVDQLRELVGRVSLKEILRESTDLIERLCIEAALKLTGDNRASAAQLLGLSRQGLYSKLRRYGLGDLESIS